VALRGVFEPYVSLSRFVILLVVAALDGFVELDNFFVLQENPCRWSPLYYAPVFTVLRHRSLWLQDPGGDQILKLERARVLANA